MLYSFTKIPSKCFQFCWNECYHQVKPRTGLLCWVLQILRNNPRNFHSNHRKRRPCKCSFHPDSHIRFLKIKFLNFVRINTINVIQNHCEPSKPKIYLILIKLILTLFPSIGGILTIPDVLRFTPIIWACLLLWIWWCWGK